MRWFRVLCTLLLVQHCNANGYGGTIEGSGVCGCGFTCEAFRGSGATTCYIMYQKEDGMWHQEEHSLIHEGFLDQRECNTGFRPHCYMFIAYPSYLQLSCVDSHNLCRRASGGIAKIDMNHELYDFSSILASNLVTDYQIKYSYKTIAGDLWYYNSVIQNKCMDVQSLNVYGGSDVQASNCRGTFKPVNSILCENAPLPINSYCAPLTAKPTKKPRSPTTVVRKVTQAMPKRTPSSPNAPTANVFNRPNVGPGLTPPPTWWPQDVTTKNAVTKSKFKKKKMVVNHQEPHNKKKKKGNVTHIVTGIFFVGTIVMVGFALLIGCFFRRRHDNRTDIFKWSNASELADRTQEYEEVDARNAVSDHVDGYSVINTKRYQNTRIDSVSQKLSQEDCRRYRLSKAMSTDVKYGDDLKELHYQQDIMKAQNASPGRLHKTRVRSYDVDRTSSGISVCGSSRSSALYEIRGLEYDYAYTSNNHVFRSPFNQQYIGNVQEPSYDYAYATSKWVKKTKKNRPRKKRVHHLHGDI
ncbi:uncharacterized protein [Antedon mediterranea]|uniref:uncharacterized protein n=1 Tax=Antedon mediterranea TaxID=105859 RepID=UPI003AF82E14